MKFASIAMTFIALLLLSGCGGAEHKKPAEVAAAIGLLLPAEAKVIEYTSDGSVIDEIWACKMVFNDSSIDGFVAALNAKKDLEGHYDSSFPAQLHWWKPKDILKTKVYELNDGSLVTVILTGGGSKAYAYIERAQF